MCSVYNYGTENDTPNSLEQPTRISNQQEGTGSSRLVEGTQEMYKM